MSDRRMQSSRDDRRRDRDGDRPRRRSRSPGGHRQREETDSYQSSRNYREREREQRYGGGDRDRREWDRDRGSARRDARRDDDRRHDHRRDRDLFDDRRRPRDGNRYNNRERDNQERDDQKEMQAQSREKEATPERKIKEPTPDLTDVVSVLQRKRRITNWDIKPPGYDTISAEQAKLSGMFPLPGAPRAQPMDQSRLKDFMSQPQNQVSAHALKAATSRQSKRVFITNIPASATDASLADFFNLQLNGINVTRENDPCASASIATDHKSAMLEFKNPEDATNALALDGIELEPESMDTSNGSSNGTIKGLQIRRPKDYIVPMMTDETQNENGLFSGIVADSQNKIMITNIPLYLDEEQIRELFQSFGELRGLIVAKDSASGQSRGFGFLEYADGAITDTAVESLNGMALGDVALKVAKACVGINQVQGEVSVNTMNMMASSKNDAQVVTRVLCLMNMVTQDELVDPDEAEEIEDDVKMECSKYGTVLATKMPRPKRGQTSDAGIGKIYVKYEDSNMAQQALTALAGRKFADRTVVAVFYSEEYFDVNAW